MRGGLAWKDCFPGGAACCVTQSTKLWLTIQNRNSPILPLYQPLHLGHIVTSSPVVTRP